MSTRSSSPATAPVADVEFWNSVRELAMTGDADLALLEVAGPFAQRWLTVPASGEIAAVRAVLEPGARITVFPSPPAADFVAPGATGDERFHGFVDGTYRGVTVQRVPAFLAQVPAGTKWGLYRDDDPQALRATAAARAAGATAVSRFAPDDFEPDPGMPSPAPRRWELQTSALFALLIVAALAGVAISALDLTVNHAIEAGTGADLPGWALDMLNHSNTVDTLYFATILAYLGGLRWWRGATRVTLLIFGNGDFRPLRNPLLRLWGAFILLALLVRFTGGPLVEQDSSAGAVASVARLDGITTILRVLGLLSLLFAVWWTRKQVRRTIAYAVQRPGEAPAPAPIAETW